MKKSDLMELIGKENIKIILKNKYQYNGVILSVSEDSLKFRDKFGEIILISNDNISLVRENIDGGKHNE